MKGIAQIASLALLSSCATAALPANSLVGTVVPPYPHGLTHRHGACVGEGWHPDEVCAYSIGFLENDRGRRVLVYGGRLESRDRGAPYWRVLDAIPYPVVRSGQYLALAACQHYGRDDRSIFAVVRSADEEWFSEIVSAHRLDIEGGKFVAVETKGLRCRNEGWGVD